MADTLTLYKLIVLKMLDEADAPLTGAQITDFILEKEYTNYHFEEEVKDGDISFNYRLNPGRATTRNAIRLLEIMGYDQSIIEKASRRAEHFISTGKWS